jgi:hypothetical protein
MEKKPFPAWSSRSKPSATWLIFIPTSTVWSPVAALCPMAGLCAAGNRRKEAGKRFSPQGFKDACRGEKDRQRNGGKAPFLEKIPFQRSPPGQNPKRDRRGRESLAQYILRSPFSLEKMTYQRQTQTVLYRITAVGCFEHWELRGRRSAVAFVGIQGGALVEVAMAAIVGWLAYRISIRGTRDRR